LPSRMFAVNNSMKYPAPLSLPAYLGCIREVSRKVASATRMLRRPRFSDGGSIRNIQVYQIEPGTIHQGRAGYIVLQASHGDGALRMLEEHQGRRGQELVESSRVDTPMSQCSLCGLNDMFEIFVLLVQLHNDVPDVRVKASVQFRTAFVRRSTDTARCAIPRDSS
jgi:hypothetical protein